MFDPVARVGSSEDFMLLTDALWTWSPAILLAPCLSSFFSFWSYKASTTMVSGHLLQSSRSLAPDEVTIASICLLASF